MKVAYLYGNISLKAKETLLTKNSGNTIPPKVLQGTAFFSENRTFRRESYKTQSFTSSIERPMKKMLCTFLILAIFVVQPQ